jgi:hypothetical protein
VNPVHPRMRAKRAVEILKFFVEISQLRLGRGAHGVALRLVHAFEGAKGGIVEHRIRIRKLPRTSPYRDLRIFVSALAETDRPARFDHAAPTFV